MKKEPPILHVNLADLGLTMKQQMFCRWYVAKDVNGNATEAAVRAGYSGPRPQVAARASVMMNNPKIQTAISRLGMKALRGAEVTIESVLKDIVRIGQKAEDAEEWGAALKAQEHLGKYLKMFSDRVVAVTEENGEEKPIQVVRLPVAAFGEVKGDRDDD